MSGTVVLENAVLDRLARNPMAVTKLPFLRQLAVSLETGNKSGCGSCGNRTPDASFVRNVIKTHIINGGAAYAQKLKDLLSADHVQIFYNDGVSIKDRTI